MKKVLVVITIILLVYLSINAVAWNDCPFGLVDEPYPGTCPRYIDTNIDGICDHSQSEFTEEIEDNTPLFVEGLGLDSIDALELIVLLEKKYGLKINTAEEGKKVLHSVHTMAEHIAQHQNK